MKIEGKGVSALCSPSILLDTRCCVWCLCRSLHGPHFRSTHKLLGNLYSTWLSPLSTRHRCYTHLMTTEILMGEIMKHYRSSKNFPLLSFYRILTRLSSRHSWFHAWSLPVGCIHIFQYQDSQTTLGTSASVTLFVFLDTSPISPTCWLLPPPSPDIPPGVLRYLIAFLVTVSVSICSWLFSCDIPSSPWPLPQHFPFSRVFLTFPPPGTKSRTYLPVHHTYIYMYSRLES